MAKVKPFKGVRPPRELVTEVSSRPYDVLNSEEARAEAEGNPKSLYHIIKPEIDFAPGQDEHAPEVYDKAVENFKAFRKNGWLVQDEKEHYYIYAQTMDGRTQYGFVVAASVEDYLTGKIKKHELTRRDKEEDRMKHVRVQNANIEPVFFAFPDDKILADIITRVTAEPAEYDFVSADGFGHHFWVIDDDTTIAAITAEFAKIPALYIADGHHRTAAAALVGAEKKNANPNHRGDEEYNYFLAVAFPASHLHIIDYNRLVKDLNGLSPAEFLEKLQYNFEVHDMGTVPYRPKHLHDFSLYLEGRWYSLVPRPGTYDDDDTISQHDVMRIADTGNIMPPKTTWFEPKLRSGLVIHKLDD